MKHIFLTRWYSDIQPSHAVQASSCKRDNTYSLGNDRNFGFGFGCFWKARFGKNFIELMVYFFRVESLGYHQISLYQPGHPCIEINIMSSKFEMKSIQSDSTWLWYVTVFTKNNNMPLITKVNLYDRLNHFIPFIVRFCSATKKKWFVSGSANFFQLGRFKRLVCHCSMSVYFFISLTQYWAQFSDCYQNYRNVKT